MRSILRIFISIALVLTLLVTVLLAGLWWVSSQALEDSARITEFPNASLADIQRIKQLAITASTRRIDTDEQSLILNERDINLGMGYFGPTQVRIPQDSYGRVELGDNSAVVTLTFPAKLIEQNRQQLLPENATELQIKMFDTLANWVEEKWLNIDLLFSIDGTRAKSDWFQLRQISVGSLPLTRSLSEYIADYARATFMQQSYAKTAQETWDNVTGLSLSKEELVVRFVLPQSGQALSSYQSLVFSNEEQERIQHYYDVIRSLPRRGPLTRVIAPLFAEAINESNRSLNPVAENRAALLALAKLYGGDKLLQMLNTEQSPRALLRAPKPYTIYNRQDLAQHFVLSSGLTLMANKEIAELIGLDKEIADLTDGRTISAWDLLADKAGARLATKATSSAKNARNVQLTLSKVKRDEHLLPDLGREFALAEDRFHTSELDELNELIELYLQDHLLLEN